MFYTAIQFQFSRMAGDVDFDPNANKREKALISTFWNGFSHAKVRISCKPCFLVACADMDMCVGMRKPIAHAHTNQEGLPALFKRNGLCFLKHSNLRFVQALKT